MPAAQGRLFVMMLCCGAALGIVRGALGLALRGGAACAALDLALGVSCALGMIVIGLYLGESPFRLYAFAGVLSGLALDVVVLGTIVRLSHRIFMEMSKKVEK